MPSRAKNPLPFIVVLEYTDKVPSHVGARTWTAYESKEAFDKWFVPHIRERRRVVAEGVTEERAIALCAAAFGSTLAAMLRSL